MEKLIALALLSTSLKKKQKTTNQHHTQPHTKQRKEALKYLRDQRNVASSKDRYMEERSIEVRFTNTKGYNRDLLGSPSCKALLVLNTHPAKWPKWLLVLGRRILLFFFFFSPEKKRGVKSLPKSCCPYLSPYCYYQPRWLQGILYTEKI